MSNIKIREHDNADDTIRHHALTAIKGCRDLVYSVCTASFDNIWWRTRARVDRSFPEPRLEIFLGRHYVLVVVDDDVPMDEVKLVEDSVPCPARHRQLAGSIKPTDTRSFMLAEHDRAAERRAKMPDPLVAEVAKPACVCGQAPCRCRICERCGATVHGFHRWSDCFLRRGEA